MNVSAIIYSVAALPLLDATRPGAYFITNVTVWISRLKLTYPTSISIGLCSVSILKPVVPRSLILGSGANALPRPISSLESVAPFSFVDPFPFAFHSDAVSLPLCPCSLVSIATRPGVYSHHLEPVAPRARVLSLPLWSGTDAISMGLAILPAPTIRPSIIKIEPATPGHAWNEDYNSEQRRRLGYSIGFKQKQSKKHKRRATPSNNVMDPLKMNQRLVANKIQSSGIRLSSIIIHKCWHICREIL